MKVAVCSYGMGQHCLNAYGGLEVRFAVNWAAYLEQKGHEVHFINYQNSFVDESFDLAIDCLIEKCDNIHAKHHIHTNFSSKSLNAPEVQSLPCYQEGKYLYGSPYRVDYNKSLALAARGYKHTPVFMPIPYIDAWKPKSMRSFQRTGIMWCNKGNFAADFGPDRNPEYVENGLNLLRALVRLNKKVDFQIHFLLDSLIRDARPEYREEIGSLIGQLKQVSRKEKMRWTDLIQLMSTCKLNTHAGGLTSSVNEALFTETLPVTPEKFIHLATVDLLPHATTATEQEIYEVYERLWFDPQLYYQSLMAFEDHFQDHRDGGVEKAWMRMCNILGLPYVQ